MRGDWTMRFGERVKELRLQRTLGTMALSDQLPDGEGEFGRGSQAAEQVHPDVIGRKNIGYQPGKFGTHPAAVVGDGHADVLPGEGTRASVLVDVVAKPLRSGTRTFRG